MKKEGFNAFNNYSYTSERQLKEVFQPLLKEAGIIFKVDVTDQRVEPGDGKMRLTLITMQYHFFDSESGESLEGTFCSQGADSGDKGIFKAITGGIKYILSSIFLIPTGDDPEKDEEVKPATVAMAVNANSSERKALIKEASALLKQIKTLDLKLYNRVIENKHPSDNELKSMIASMKSASIRSLQQQSQ